MLKKLLIIAMLVVCCYCEEATKNVTLPEEGREKKNKKSLRLLAMVVLFVLSKIVVIKAATFFFFLAFFQKLFSVGGVLLTYFMKNQLGMAMAAPPAMPAPAPSVAPPSTSYGSPSDYNTLGFSGYSYGPPDHDAAFHNEGPSIADLGGPYNWILNKP